MLRTGHFVADRTFLYDSVHIAVPSSTLYFHINHSSIKVRLDSLFCKPHGVHRVYYIMAHGPDSLTDYLLQSKEINVSECMVNVLCTVVG